MRKKELRKPNYFFLFGLFAINLVSLLLLSAFNYRFFYLEEERAYEEKFRSSAAKEIEIYVENIDVQLKTMLSIPSLYFSETSDNRALLHPQEQSIIGDAREIRSLGSVLSKIQKTYPFLYSMDIYYEGTGTIVTSFAYVHEERSPDRLWTFLPWLEKLPQDMDRSCFLPFGVNSYPNAFPTLSYVQKITNKRWEGDGIYIALHFDPQLVQLPDKGFYQSAWILDQSGNVVYESSDFEWQRQIVESMDHQGDGRNVTRQISNEDGKFVAWSNTSYNTNLTYCSFIGYKMLYPGYSEDNTRLVKNFILLILCNVLSLGLLTLLNYQVYKNYIVSFSHNVGIRMKGSLWQTLKTMETTIESLDDESRSYKNQTLLRALLTNRANKEMYDDVYASLKGDYVCCLIVEQTPEDFAVAPEVVQVCAASLSEIGTVFFTTFASPARIVFALILDEMIFPEIALQEIRKMGIGLRIDIGSVCPLRSNGFQNSFASAMDVLAYRFLSDDTDVLRHDVLRMDAKRPFADHTDLLAQIGMFMKSDQKGPARQLIEKLVGDLRSGEYSVQYCKATLGDLITSIYSILSQNKIDMWAILGYDIRAFSKKIASLTEYAVWLDEITGIVVDALSEQRENMADSLACRIERIVTENLSHDISLGLLAGELGIREDALSRSFKSIMGCNYIEYVTEKKLKKAVELLYQDVPVQEISMALGYRSPQYFIKVFKNAYGVTPHKFRKHNKRFIKESP